MDNQYNNYNQNGWQGYIPDQYMNMPNGGQQYGGQPGMPNPQAPKKPIWAAVTSFVLSLVSMFLCCCNCNYILVILGLVFGIISLAMHGRGKGMAITGIVISSIMLVVMITMTILSHTLMKGVSDYYMNVATNPDKYIQEYLETGEPPEELQKFNDEKYDELWESMGFESFDEVYKVFIEAFIESYNQSSGKNYSLTPNSGSSSKPDRDREYDDDDDESSIYWMPEESAI